MGAPTESVRLMYLSGKFVFQRKSTLLVIPAKAEFYYFSIQEEFSLLEPP